MIREAIILAGGLGTRLRERVPDLPKCMAPVDGQPFLTYVVRHLLSQGIQQFIFSLGYKHGLIEHWLEANFSYLDYRCVVEDHPLGTGGAIKLALEKSEQENVLVVNGDTLFKINLATLSAFHQEANAHCSLGLKPMHRFDRYGLVELNPNHSVAHFAEKKFYEKGLINGGAYILKREQFLSAGFPEKFSFEKDYLERNAGRGTLFGNEQDAYFIDIGIPEDYERAQQELAYRPPDLSKIDKTWTLFLDRDGVINQDKVGSYIFNEREFIFYDGLPEDFRKMNYLFGHIVVVTNQRGVGKGLMKEADLRGIHEKMLAGVKQAQGRIDAIYYCTATDNSHPDRKPNPGMALRAKKDFPDIDLSRSIVVGNNLSDMRFGRNAGMFTVFVTTTNPQQPLPHPDIDLQYPLLTDFIRAI